MCEDIAGPDRIACTLTPNGYERPVIVGGLTHDIVDSIYAACPGVVVTGSPSPEHGANIDLVWGPHRRIDLAWAADPHVRHVGSTGGILTALGMFLLETGQVEAILHAGPSSSVPSFGEARISRTPGEVLGAAGSRYGPTAVLSHLQEALAAGDRLAVIAKPCDLSALELRAANDTRIRDRLAYRLALVCGGMMAPAGLAQRMERFGIDPAEVTGIRYRGHGCPGPTVFERGDDDPLEVTYLEFWGDDESQWVLPYRCKICPDGTGEAADLVAADTWPGASPTAEMLDDPGTNVVIARTASGERLLEAARDAGYVELGAAASIADLNLWQPHQVHKKQWAWARQAGRRRAGYMPIELRSLRAEANARARPLGELLNQADGSRVRALDGRADEPVPRRS